MKNRGILLAAVCLSLVSANVYSAGKKEKARSVKAKPVNAKSVLGSLPKKEEATEKQTKQEVKAAVSYQNDQVARLKTSLSEQMNGLNLRQKIKALAQLAENGSEDITQFLTARKIQLESEIKTSPPAIAHELRDLKFAIEKVLAMRTANRIASSQD